FEINRNLGVATGETIKILRLTQSRDAGNESAFHDCRSFIWSSRTEDQDWMGQRFPKRERFFQIGNAEELRIVGQRFGDTEDTVALGVRLDNREHLARPNSAAP